MNSSHLFPARQTRRDFLKAGTLAAAALALPRFAEAQEPVKFGSGAMTFTLDPNWGKLPDGMKYGLGCGIAVDSKDRVFVTTRSESPCVAVFDRDGKVLETWSQDLRLAR
jgi:peptidylamidoglycolate lyase